MAINNFELKGDLNGKIVVVRFFFLSGIGLGGRRSKLLQ